MPHRIIIEIGTLAVDGWAATFGTARMGLGRPLLAVPNVTAHPSSASVPITVLLYNGPLLCGFDVPKKVNGFAESGRDREFPVSKVSCRKMIRCTGLQKQLTPEYTGWHVLI